MAAYKSSGKKVAKVTPMKAPAKPVDDDDEDEEDEEEDEEESD